jgi:tol-pal system protein YbgF
MGRNAVKFLAYPLLLVAAGCASSSELRPETEAALQSANESAKLREQVEALQARIDSLESKLTSINDKVDATKINAEKLTAVPAQPTEAAGTPVEPSTALNDPEAGLVNDSSVQAYRQAMILFKSKKYPEAVLAFSSFIERYADHPLAGSAQFYVGESYFRQKEYKLAIEEFQRVLTSYDRSSAVPETLRQIADAEEHVRQAEDALKHRQLLLSLFPQSPSAQAVQLASKGAPAAETAAPAAGAVDAAPEGTAAPAEAATPGQLDGPPPTAPITTEPGAQ